LTHLILLQQRSKRVVPNIPGGVNYPRSNLEEPSSGNGRPTPCSHLEGHCNIRPKPFQTLPLGVRITGGSWKQIGIEASITSPFPSSFVLCTPHHLSSLESCRWPSKYADASCQAQSLYEPTPTVARDSRGRMEKVNAGL